MASALAVAGIVLLVTGVVVGIAGFGLAYNGGGDAKKDDGAGSVEVGGEQESKENGGRMGRTVAFSGLALLVAGAVLTVVGRGGTPSA